jgi:hypothetical protein
MLLKLSVVIAGAALMNSLTATTNADAQNPSNALRVPLRPTIVGRELVYPDGVMVSIDKGTGLPLKIDPRTGLSSPASNPDSVPRANVIPCTAGYTCLYENINYGGRRLQWRDRNQLINLVNYEFDNKMSSWRNNNNVDARWYYGVNGTDTSRCMNAGKSDGVVGWIDNDEASSLRIYNSTTGCS